MNTRKEHHLEYSGLFICLYKCVCSIFIHVSKISNNFLASRFFAKTALYGDVHKYVPHTTAYRLSKHIYEHDYTKEIKNIAFI